MFFWLFFFFTRYSRQVEAFSQFWVLVLSSVLPEGLCFVLQVCSSCNCSFIFYFSLRSVFFFYYYHYCYYCSYHIYALAVWYCMKGDLQRRCEILLNLSNCCKTAIFTGMKTWSTFSVFLLFFCFPIKLANIISPFLAFSFNCSLLTILSV